MGDKNRDYFQNISTNILAKLASELKRPLEQVISSCELARTTGDLSEINNSLVGAKSAMGLVKSYSLGLSLATLEKDQLEVEPIALTAIVAGVRGELEQLARVYGVKLEMKIGRELLPVMINRKIIATTLVSVGKSLIESLPRSAEQLDLKFVGHKTHRGIKVGWYWQNEKITSRGLSMARDLLKASRVPFSSVTNDEASGILIGDMLLSSINSKLEASKYKNWNGLVVVLPISQQLALV